MTAVFRLEMDSICDTDEIFLFFKIKLSFPHVFVFAETTILPYLSTYVLSFHFLGMG